MAEDELDEGAVVVVVVEDDEPDDVEPVPPEAVVVSSDELEPAVVVVTPRELEVPALLVVAAVDPACSRETAMPMTAVKPAAASTTPRVSRRNRVWAETLPSGVLCRGWRDIDQRPFLLGRLDPTMPGSTPALGALCASCDIGRGRAMARPLRDADDNPARKIPVYLGGWGHGPSYGDP